MKILVEAGVNLTLVGADRSNPFKYVLQEQGDRVSAVSLFYSYVSAEKRSA